MKRKTVSGAVGWAVADAGSGAAINFCTIALLSRIFSPSDFGLVALVQAIVALAQTICGAGISEALVQRDSLDISHEDTAFAASSLLGAAGCLACCTVAFAMYLSGSDVRLPALLTVESITCLLYGLEVMPTAMLLRTFRTETLAKRTVVSRLVYLASAYSLAAASFGLWSIIIADVLQYAAGTALLLSAQSRRPQFKLKWRQFKDLVAFGAPVVVENVLWSVMTRVFSILVGKFHGFAFLGMMSMAMKTTDAVAGVMQTVSGRISLPVLARAQNDRERLAAMYAGSSEIIVLVAWPIFAGMAITADAWVPLLLGQKWLSTVPVVQILCITWIIVFGRLLVGTTLRAVGKPRAYLFAAFCAAAATILALVATGHQQPAVVAIAWSLRVLVTIPIGAFLLSKFVGISPLRQALPLVKPFCAVLSMVIAVRGWQLLFRDSSLASQPIAWLASNVAIGGIAYGIAVSTAYRKAIPTLLSHLGRV